MALPPHWLRPRESHVTWKEYIMHIIRDNCKTFQYLNKQVGPKQETGLWTRDTLIRKHTHPVVPPSEKENFFITQSTDATMHGRHGDIIMGLIQIGFVTKAAELHKTLYDRTPLTNMYLANQYSIYGIDM